jgi:radical SAM superfamily enzyme YgiQ (UPF0313 family)
MMLVPSLAMALFTSILRKAGYTVDLFDTTHYVHEISSSEENRTKWLQLRPFDQKKMLGKELQTDILGDFVRKIEDFKPDLMVVSVVEDTFLQAITLLDAVKDAKIPSIFGGVFCTAAPEKAISYPQVQMMGVGEGEETVKQVAERVRLGESCERVRNLWYKRPDGSIVRNPMGPLEDINKPFPDFSLFDEARFYRPMGGRTFKTVPLETYRGCPYTCTFCNSPMQVTVTRENKLGNFLRRKRIATVRDEIQFMIDRHNPEYFFIVDDSFLARPDAELREFIDMYQEFKIPFWFNTRPENITPERLELLKSVNCDRMSFGMECGNEEYRRKVITRAPTNEKVLECFETIAKGRIAYSVNSMIGFPGEDRDMIFETIELNRQLRGYDSLSQAIFTPYRGTKLRELAVEKGYLDPDSISTHTTSTSMLKMPQISPQELNGLIKTFNLYVRFPKEEWPRIRLAEADTEEGDKIFEEYQVSFNARFLNGTQKTPEDWQDPERYAVAPEGAEAKADKPWGWNCGAEQTEYAVPPSDSAN